MNDGKLFDVLIEDATDIDQTTGADVFVGFRVWADKGLERIIDSVPGVHSVQSYRTFYLVTLDPRYDREWLRAEIEAVILCYDPDEEKKLPLFSSLAAHIVSSNMKITLLDDDDLDFLAGPPGEELS